MKIKSLALALLSFAVASVANAIPVTVDSVEYNITTITTTFDNDSALLMSQPWWNNVGLASQLATAVGANLGMPNLFFGPYFAYEYQPTFIISRAFDNFSVVTPTESPRAFSIVAPVPDSASTLMLTAGALFAALFVWGRSKRA